MFINFFCCEKLGWHRELANWRDLVAERQNLPINFASCLTVIRIPKPKINK